MQKIGSLTDTADANGEFTDGSGASGVESTLLPAAWFNTVQRELANIVTGAGWSLDPKNDYQVLPALKAIFPVITSKGTNANGQWRVWADGTYEMWGAGGTIDASTGLSHVNFPIAFPSAPRTIFLQQMCGGRPGALVNTQLDDSTRTTTGFNAYTLDASAKGISAGYMWHAIYRA